MSPVAMHIWSSSVTSQCSGTCPSSENRNNEYNGELHRRCIYTRSVAQNCCEALRWHNLPQPFLNPTFYPRRIIFSTAHTLAWCSAYLCDCVACLQLLGTGCNLRDVGYKYQSHHNLFQEKDFGQVASMTFTKKRNDTVLKLSYSSNIRTHGALAATRWFFRIDGQECRKPTTIDIGMWQNTADNMHVPAVLTGICESIDPTGAGLRYGQHTISVQVGPMRNFAIANANSGWYTTSILEVQELCPQF